MMILAKVFFIGMGSLFIAIGIYHEVSWLRKSMRVKTKGKVIDHERKGCGTDIAYFPIITYSRGDEETKFTSNYGWNSPPVPGTIIDIVFNPESGEAEHISTENRFVGTVGALIFGGIFVAVGICLSN